MVFILSKIIKEIKQRWVVSSRLKLHLLVKRRFYACNGATFGARGKPIEEHNQFPELKCKRCLQILGEKK